MLVCSEETSHTIHLACWGRWAGNTDERTNCPVTDCWGFATSATIASHEIQDRIVQRMQELSGESPGQANQGQANQGEANWVCSICYEEFPFVAGDYGGAAWWCSGNPEHRVALIYCTTCKDRTTYCPMCRPGQVAFVAASRLNPVVEAPQAPQFHFRHEISGCRGTGKPQTGMLCYAAATATAILWATGQDFTIYECMHLYIMSGQAASEADFDEYRMGYATIKASPDYADDTVGFIIDNVFRGGDEWYGRVFNSVCSRMGTPVFPGSVSAQLHYQGISAADLTAAIQYGNPVIKGEGNHWVVIFGVCGTSENNITHITVYDPMANAYRDIAWTPATKADYYIVG